MHDVGGSEGGNTLAGTSSGRPDREAIERMNSNRVGTAGTVVT